MFLLWLVHRWPWFLLVQVNRDGKRLFIIQDGLRVTGVVTEVSLYLHHNVKQIFSACTLTTATHYVQIQCLLKDQKTQRNFIPLLQLFFKLSVVDVLNRSQTSMTNLHACRLHLLVVDPGSISEKSSS